MTGQGLTKSLEGFRAFLYLDTLGNLTGGYGHHFREKTLLPSRAAEILFEHDYGEAVGHMLQLDLTWLNEPRQAVIIDMIFNMGLTKFVKFKRMLKNLKLARESGDYLPVMQEMQDSRWHRQTKTRAKILERMMLTGEWPGPVASMDDGPYRWKENFE